MSIPEYRDANIELELIVMKLKSKVKSVSWFENAAKYFVNQIWYIFWNLIKKKDFLYEIYKISFWCDILLTSDCIIVWSSMLYCRQWVTTSSILMQNIPFFSPKAKWEGHFKYFSYPFFDQPRPKNHDVYWRYFSILFLKDSILERVK